MERTAISIAEIDGNLAGKINGPDELLTKLCEGANEGIGASDDTWNFDENLLIAAELTLSADKAYIVTEGASGLGIELAKWLVERGARMLILISRKGPKTDYDRNAIQEMISAGVNVDCECIDLTLSQVAVNCVGRVRLNAPIGGVIHCAAVVRDVSVPYMTEKVFDAVFIPKMVGAWNLHLALGDEPVEFFLNISTISRISGLSGQPIYATANKILEEFVNYRRLRGMRAQNINLGVLGQYPGVRTKEGCALHVLESQGWTPLPLEKITEKIEHAIPRESLVQIPDVMETVPEMQEA